MSFEKLRAAQLAGSESGGPVTPVYQALEVARAYQALTASWDSLLLVLSQTHRELSHSLALLHSELDVDAGWRELCQEAHEVLLGFLEQPDTGTLDPVLEALEQLEAAFLELDLKSCYERLEASSAQARLAGLLEGDIPESELVEGHYTWLEAALHRWLEGELEIEPLRALIDEHQA
ncbi:hypothetical protein DYH09_31925, partial [bacterium CPR1]|nr:hypothetical protein [bacterium CPR1]